MRVFLNFVIRWGFYLLLFFIPLAFWGDTSELFEFNKLWLTFGLTVIIVAGWIGKMIVEKRIIWKRTILDIPLGLFMVSQIISTIFSLDSHVSLWGYYSRFNGGLLSLISYVLLYFALVSNLDIFKDAKKGIYTLLKISLVSGLFVSLWGLPAHFGYDPTCLVFRGTLDVSCWTDAFQPKIRIFSTIGQPDWLAAYLAALIPITLVFAFQKWQEKRKLSAISYFLLAILFYVDFIWSDSRGGFIGIVAGMVVLWIGFLFISWQQKFLRNVTIASIVGFLLLTFLFGQPLAQLDKFTLRGIMSSIAAREQTVLNSTSPMTNSQQSTTKQPTPAPVVGELGGSDSGKIRLYVWEGAIQAFLHNPLFGTGVETFAFAYYLYRPSGHNLTSEWDYLYNKAHNEYLNYLATTGIFGLGTYLFIISLFLFVVGKDVSRIMYHVLRMKKNEEYIIPNTQYIILALLSAYVSILVSNFFGFSVVIINVFFFIIPAFALILLGKVKTERKEQSDTNVFQKILLILVLLITCYILLVLLNYWNADRSYGLGYNLDRAGAYQQAYQPLHDAAVARPGEPVFEDELALNDSVLAAAFAQAKDATNAARLAQESLTVDENVITQHPNNVTFWKTRVRILYSLAQINPQYLGPALDAILKAQSLAPTDAKVSYNVGLLYGQTNQLDNAIATLRHTITLKPDYRDAYYALGLFLHQQAVDKNGKVINPAEEKEAADTLRFILTHLGADDKAVKDTLTSWHESF